MIGNKNSDIQSIKEEIGGNKDVKVENVNILFLDISSTCTGYAIANVNFENGTAVITKSGCLWLDKDWTHQEKYLYMFEALQNYFWIVEGIDYIVVEQYTVNPSKMMGVNVVSEMQGAIKAGAWSNGVKVSSILPQTWRSALKIKKSQKGDFKEPTKDKVLELVSVPEEVISNITKKPRKTPYDVYDALAICWAWLVKFGFEKVNGSTVDFNSHIGVM